VPVRRLHIDKPSGSNPEDDGRLVSSGGLEDVETGERQAQPGGRHSQEREPSCEDASRAAGAALAAAERIRAFAHQASEVVAKAELFGEKIGIGLKPSGTRIAMILTDYLEKLERVLEDMREVVNHVSSLRRQLERQDLAASSSKGVPNLSKLSLPDSFSGLPNVEDYVGADVTPESKGVQEPNDAKKGKSPRMKSRDVVMTSASKEAESGSGGDHFPIPDLNQRRGLKALSPDQETTGFVTPKITK
jgi:hypothetical protein